MNQAKYAGRPDGVTGLVGIKPRSLERLIPADAVHHTYHHGAALASEEDAEMPVCLRRIGYAPESFLVDPDGLVKQKRTGALTLDLWNTCFVPYLTQDKPAVPAECT